MDKDRQNKDQNQGWNRNWNWNWNGNGNGNRNRRSSRKRRWLMPLLFFLIFRHQILHTAAAGSRALFRGLSSGLSGILSAVTAYSGDPLLGTAAAAWINGKAGELAQSRAGSVSMTAGDTAECVASVIQHLELKIQN